MMPISGKMAFLYIALGSLLFWRLWRHLPSNILTISDFAQIAKVLAQR